MAEIKNFMRTILAILLITGGALLHAAECPTVVPVVSVKTSGPESSIPQPSSGKSLLVVVIGNAHYSIVPLLVDGRVVGANKSHTYFYAEIEPGAHVLCSGAIHGIGSMQYKVSGMRLEAEPEKTYYLEQVIPFDDTIVKLAPVDDVQATTYIRRSKKASIK